MSIAPLLSGAGMAVIALGAGVQASRAMAAWRAWKAIRARADEYSPLAIDDAAAGESSPGVSILLPASLQHADTIRECVLSCLSVRHPRCEVIVICDGRGTADLLGLTADFDLREARWLHQKRLRTAPVTRTLVSRSRAQLVVIEHEGSGRADALNAGLELSRNPLTCTIDARTRLEKDALLRAASPMIEDESVLGVDGMMLPGGPFPAAPALLRGVVQQIAAIEVLRRSFLGTAAGTAFGAPAWLSSGFALYRRDILIALGGWSPDCLDPDAELGARLHRLAAPPMGGRIEVMAEPMGWRVCTGRVSELYRQWRDEASRARDLRKRGLSATANVRAAWRTMGWSGWLFPVALAVAAASGAVAVAPLAWAAALYLVLGVTVSLSILSMESMLKCRTERTTDKLMLMGAAVLWELLRPIAAVATVHGLLRMRRLTRRNPGELQVPRAGIDKRPAPVVPAGNQALVISAAAGAAATPFDHPPARDA